MLLLGNNTHVTGPMADFGNITTLLDAVDLVEARRKAEASRDRRPLVKGLFSDYSARIHKRVDLDFVADDSDYTEPRAKKGSRKRIDPESVKILGELFDSGVHFPSREEREKLASRLALPGRTIQIWFQNRRQALKNKKQSMLVSQSALEDRHADENLAPILMTKLRYDKTAHQLVETKSSMRLPSYLPRASPAPSAKDSSARSQSQGILSRKLSIVELIKADAHLPRPPSVSRSSPVLLRLSCDLPKLHDSSGNTEGRLPSVGHALRRLSVT